ncbi:TPA: hypothetical protein ACOTG6_001548 [Clostridium perfringens]
MIREKELILLLSNVILFFLMVSSKELVYRILFFIIILGINVIMYLERKNSFKIGIRILQLEINGLKENY